MENTKQTHTSKNSQTTISVLRAYNTLLKKKSGTKRDVLLDCKIEPNPRGLSKKWEIQLSFFHVFLKVGSLRLGKPFKGSFTCHQTGNFVTYCLNLKGRDYWFDQYELALAALSQETLLLCKETKLRNHPRVF